MLMFDLQSYVHTTKNVLLVICHQVLLTTDFEIDHSKYCLIDLPKNCDDMCKLAQMVIPEFDPTSGNGYTEFLEPQFIKADQRIVLQDEVGKVILNSHYRKPIDYRYN